MDPTIEQRFVILICALISAALFSLIAWRNGFWHASPYPSPNGSALKFTDVLKVFAVFFLIELFFVPLILLLWMFIKTGQFHLSHKLLSDIHIQGWFNLLTITLASLGVLCYGLLLEPLKLKMAFWGASPPTANRLFRNLRIGVLTWVLSYPFVVLIGQMAGITTTLLGYGQHVDQVAVKHLRETMQFPILFALTVFAVVFLVPMAEEILFRGFFQRWLTQKKGKLLGIALTSIVFASFHFSISQNWDNIELLLSLFVLSCFLGYIYERQGSLWAPIGLHMTFNAISIAFILITAPAAIFSQAAEEGPKAAPPSNELLESYLHTTIQGNNAFSFAMYAKLRGTGGNLCFSPYSISSAIALPFAGSTGATQGDMRIVMHYLDQAKQVLVTYSMLDKLYSTPWYLGPNESKIYLGNSLWLQQGFKVLPSFLDTIPTIYRTLIKTVDFVRNPEGAGLNINAWVKEKTQGRIPKQVNKEDFGQNTQMLVASSIFMKGVWSVPFNPSLTKEAPFFIDRLTTGSVNMMLTTGKFRLYRAGDFTLLELPFRPDYRGIPTLALMVVLPTTNFGLASIEQKFYSEQWNSWIAQLKEEGVIVSIPSFSFLQSFDLTQLLKSMGMSFVFSENADFSGLSDKGNLSLSSVVHDAYLAIDEKGSDAIAANPISINPQTFLSKTTTYAFTADHPFIFLVVDSTNNMIIYMGRYIKP